MRNLKKTGLAFWKKLLPISSPNQEFIEWSNSAPPETATKSFDIQQYIGGRGTPNDAQALEFFQKITNELDNKDNPNKVIDIKISNKITCPIQLSAKSSGPNNYIRYFGIHGEITHSLKLDSLYISNLSIYSANIIRNKITIENSYIALLLIGKGMRADLELVNTYIGRLELIQSACIRRLNMYRGGITEIDIAPPGSDSPFTGSISFVDTYFPTEKNMAQGAQPYRNMRHHLRRLENIRMADKFHALELKTERHEETWTNRIFSYLYEKFSDFGASILRPILWLLLLGFSVSYILITWDGAIPTRALESSAVGWQTAMLGNDIAAPIYRGFYLSFYSIIHPLGLFGGQPVLVASTHWLSGLLIIEGIFSATLVALTIFAIRRRFKLQQT